VYLYSNSSQLTHYKWLQDGSQTVNTYFLPQRNITNWHVCKDSNSADILFSTADEGIFIYHENTSGLYLITNELNYYIGSSDHQFADIDNNDKSEMILIVGSSLVIKDHSDNYVKEFYTFTLFISSLKTWQVDSTNIPVLLVVLEDGSIAIADPLGRLITAGSAAVVTDLTYDPDNEPSIDNNSVSIPRIQLLIVMVTMMFSIIGTLIILHSRHKQLEKIKWRSNDD
jgi:hypothetical protein